MGATRPRIIAYQALRRSEAPGDFVEHRLEADAGFRALSREDRGLAQELVLGVVRRRPTLDWLLARRTEGRRQRPEVRTVLHVGLYQLLFLDRIPPHAAVHETVELARSVGLSAQTGFVNAVLRGLLREIDGVRQALEDLRSTDLATATAHPAWLVDRWRERLGSADLVRLLDLDNRPPGTFARVNRARIQPAALLAAWAAEGVTALPRSFPWQGPEVVFELREHPPLAGLGSFQRGEFYVQDPSTLLAVTLLDPRPGEAILDACAAPGGKTALLAARVAPEGRVLAEDLHPDRLALLSGNIVRLGLTGVTVAVASQDPEVVGEGGFDRVLVDAPCSNTGVLRRRVEARWRLQPASLAGLQEAQRRILSRAARRVRPGGVLVYSTCSLEPEENAGQVDAFLRDEPGFRLEDRQEVLPWRDEVDGAFAARLRRTGSS